MIQLCYYYLKQGILNVKIHKDGTVISESHLAKVTGIDEHCELQKIPNTETKCALLANLFLSEGKPGQVLRVNCKKRTGPDNFITSIREILVKKYTGEVVVGESNISNHLNIQIINDFFLFLLKY